MKAVIDTNIAAALTLDAVLWSGDKKLVEGLRKKGADFLIQTGEILEMFSNLSP